MRPDIGMIEKRVLARREFKPPYRDYNSPCDDSPCRATSRIQTRSDKGRRFGTGSANEVGLGASAKAVFYSGGSLCYSSHRKDCLLGSLRTSRMTRFQFPRSASLAHVIFDLRVACQRVSSNLSPFAKWFQQRRIQFWPFFPNRSQ